MVPPMKPAVLLLLATTSVFAQTAAPKPHTASTTAKPAAKKPTSASLDAPPGVPKVVGVPKVLYALRYIDTVVGKGELAVPRKWYTVNYTGYLTTGKKFDSSFDRNQPITFPYGAKRVIAGWDTGFEGMHIGGKRRLFIPYELAYGEQGNPVIPAKSNLIFDVELLAMSDTPPAPPAPPAGATPPPAKPATPPPAGAPAATGTTAPATPAPATTTPAPTGTATPPPTKQ
ncbi:peptidylprolyl isomerase [Granulicella pectinivorans]|uniref:Peptidyl-prolyl cis-trans isomerase n=2 Tax=Granulicella pectinivorans TaxID=474950 RepID=A0A1I6MG85_9BACT|nr:peptidylprolyl isomerase [Granulicella pectinivorans]